MLLGRIWSVALACSIIIAGSWGSAFAVDLQTLDAQIFAEEHAKELARAEAGPSKWAVSLEDNFIFNRSLDKSGDVTGGEIKNANQLYGKLDYVLTDNLGFYIKLGASNMQHQLDWNIGSSQTIKYNYGFLAGGGTRLHYPLYNGLGFGSDAQLNWWYNQADSISGDNNPVLVDKGSYNNLQAQAAFYLDYNYALNKELNLAPYAGVYCSFFKSFADKKVKFHDNNYEYTGGDLKGKDYVGPLLGLSAAFNKNIILKVEGRFVSETALTAEASYKF